MKYHRQILSASLAALTLLSCSACAKADGAAVNTGADVSQTAAETTAEVTTELAPTLPDVNYNGLEIMFLTEHNDGYDWYTSKEIYASEQTGELFNDAVYKRNLIIEEKYGVKIAQTCQSSAHSVAQKSLTAGDTQFDVVMPYINNSINLAQQGLLMDLNSVPYLELENPWWDQRANENLALGGKLFFTTGDISILDNECTMVMFFNKNMISDYSLDDPYKLVRDGKWTLDSLSGLALGVTSDINGDGKMTNDDQWGLSVASNAPISFYFGSGERIAKSDENGEMQLTMNSERASGVVSKVMELCFSPEVISNHTTKQSGYDQVCPVFNDARVMFVTFALVDINGLRDAEFEFGILPYPKFDEAQESYNNLISTGLVGSTSVPYNCQKLEAVGVTLEALAYYSVDTLTVAYYDNALKTRYVRDEDSGEMLDIIFATRVYDLGFIFNWGNAGSLITSMYESKSDAFASKYAAIEEKAQAAMQKTLDAFDAIG